MNAMRGVLSTALWLTCTAALTQQPLRPGTLHLHAPAPRHPLAKSSASAIAVLMNANQPRTSKSSRSSSSAEPPAAGKPRRLRALASDLQKIPASTDVTALGEMLAPYNLVQNNFTTLLHTFKKRQKWRVASLLADWAETPGCSVRLTATHYNLLMAASKPVLNQFGTGSEPVLV